MEGNDKIDDFNSEEDSGFKICSNSDEDQKGNEIIDNDNDDNQKDDEYNDNDDEDEEYIGDFVDSKFPLEGEDEIKSKTDDVPKTISNTNKSDNNNIETKNSNSNIIQENQPITDINNNNNNIINQENEEEEVELNENEINKLQTETPSQKIKIERSPQNYPSKLEFSEANYYVLKTELETLLAKDTFVSLDDISKQNTEMISYLKKLNEILTFIIESTQNNNNNNSRSKKKLPQQIDQKAKLVDVYKKEYLRLESRVKQLSDPSYEEHLIKTLNNLNTEISKIEKQNKLLQQNQKQNEIKIDKQTQNVTKAEKELKRLQTDYENIINQQTLLEEKVNKNKNIIHLNNSKINELNEWQQKLEKIAKGMYDIQEYENVDLEEEKERQLMEKRNALLKKQEIYKKVLKTNKMKYEIEIAKNERIIFDLEKSKADLLQKYKLVVGKNYYKTDTEFGENNQN